MNNFVYVDCETTGLAIWKKRKADECVSVSILDDNGNSLFHSLIKPLKIKSWDKAQDIHGISPKMVENAPFFDDVKEKLKQILKNKDVVFYNWSFDSFFLRDVLVEVNSIYCCMREYADLQEDCRWKKLIDAVFQVNSNFKFNAHNSLEDCKATREVWHYLLENSGDFADYKDVFMEKVELLNTKNKKYYFVIPEAKNDETLRNEIKEYGAYWENKKQAWVLFCRENDEIPEFFNKFQQLKARDLPNYTKKYFTVNHPRLLSEKLKKFGCQYDRKEYSWYILVQEKDKKLPEDLQKFINENS